MNFKVQPVKQLKGVCPSRLDTDTLGWLPIRPTDLKHRCLTSWEWNKINGPLRLHEGFHLRLDEKCGNQTQTKVVIWGHTLKLESINHSGSFKRFTIDVDSHIGNWSSNFWMIVSVGIVSTWVSCCSWAVCKKTSAPFPNTKHRIIFSPCAPYRAVNTNSLSRKSYNCFWEMFCPVFNHENKHSNEANLGIPPPAEDCEILKSACLLMKEILGWNVLSLLVYEQRGTETKDDVVLMYALIDITVLLVLLEIQFELKNYRLSFHATWLKVAAWACEESIEFWNGSDSHMDTQIVSLTLN